MDKTDGRNKLVTKEQNRLRNLLKDISPQKLKAAEGLITQAARHRVLLDEMWIDITENGDYEMFSQSPNTPPYERERPVARLYNARDQAYQRIIKQLTDLLPSEEAREEVRRSASDLI